MMQPYRLHRKTPALLLFGDLLRGREDHVALFDECLRIDADIVEVDLGTRKGFVLQHPDAARVALVEDNQWLARRGNLETAAIARFLGRSVLTVDGEDWLAFRRLNAPAFTRGAVEAARALVDDSVARSLAVWLPAGAARRPLFRDFLALAVTATTAAFLSARPDDEEQHELLQALLRGPEIIIQMVRWRAPWLLALPVARMRDMRGRIAAVERLVRRSVARRRAAGLGAQPDLLDLVLQHRHAGSGAALDDGEVRDHLFTAIIAAPENIATTLAFASFALQANPPVLKRLRASLASGDDSYLQAVIQETMRRFAPTPIVNRTAIQEGRIGDVRVPRGSLVVVPILGLHNHPRYWEAPEQFLPERFLAQQTPRAYFPFGHGPRKCIGERLGRSVIESALRRFVEGFDWSRPDGAVPGYTPLISLRPRDDMVMDLRCRG